MTPFTTMLDQCTKKSWWGNATIIKMTAPEAQAFTLKEAITALGRPLSMDDFKEETGFTHGQVRSGLKLLEKDPDIFKVRISLGPKRNINFWGIK